MTATLTNDQLLNRFAMVDPADVLAVVGIEHEHCACACADCTEPAAAIVAGFNGEGEMFVAPICLEHAKTEAPVASAVQFDAYKALTLLQVVSRRAVERLIEAEAFPFVARSGNVLESTALFFRNADGVAGFVPIIMPFEEGDMLVEPAPSLQFMVEVLKDDKHLSFMGSSPEHRLMMVEADMSKFVAFPGGAK